MDLKTLVILLIAGVVSLLLDPKFSAAKPTVLKDLKELLKAAEQIESAATQTPITDQKRQEILSSFVRESMSTYCEVHYQEVTKLANDYKTKAHEFVDDMTTGEKNWFISLGLFGSPLKDMNKMGKLDPLLDSITKRYDQAKRNGQAVTHDDVDCDILKFKIRSLKDMVFVLQTHVRQLILGETQIINVAIRDKLKTDKYISTTNFYEIRELNAHQKQLVLNYFARRVDPETTTVGKAVDHFVSLNSLIIGRLIESCRKLCDYREIWHDLDIDRSKVCPKSNSDPNNQLFSKEFKIEAFEETSNFCQSFLKPIEKTFE